MNQSTDWPPTSRKQIQTYYINVHACIQINFSASTTGDHNEHNFFLEEMKTHLLSLKTNTIRDQLAKTPGIIASVADIP